MSPLSGDQYADAVTPTPSVVHPEEVPREVQREGLSLTKIEESRTGAIDVPHLVVPVHDPADQLLGISRRPGRPPRGTQAPVTWSVRGVSRETRRVFEQGAARTGKTLGQFLDEDVRALVEQQLAGKAEPASLQAEIQYLRRLVENLTTMMVAATGQNGEATPPNG